MSLSWLDRLTLYVHPRRVILERQPWRGAPRRQVIEVAVPAGGEADWQPVLAATEAALAADGRRGGSARVVIADHFVRYALLPWSDGIAGNKARRAVAQALLRNSLGERADGLEIALDWPRFRRPGLGAGIDKPFIEGLRAALKRRRIAAASIRPRLVSELERKGRNQAIGDGFFVCADSDRLTLAGFRGGSLVCLRNQRAAADELGAELSGLLAAEAGTAPAETVFLCPSPAASPVILTHGKMVLWPSCLPEAGHA